MTPTQRQQYALAVCLVSATLVLGGCGLFSNKPTPLPWLPTATPLSTAEAQTDDNTTPAPLTPQPSVTPTAAGEASPTPLPSPSPSPSPTEAREAQHITIDVPLPGATVSNPVLIRGHARKMPFEATLVVLIYDIQDRLIVQEPILATGDLDGPAFFETRLMIGGQPGPGRIEVVDLSPEDGSELSKAGVEITLEGFPGGGYIEIPNPMARVTLPIGVVARVGQPGQDLNVTVTWDDGTQFAHVFTAFEGLDGRGLVIAPLDFVVNAPPRPGTQDGVIEVHTLAGSPLARQPIRILSDDDRDTLATILYWVRNDSIVPQQVRVPRTLGIGRATIEALLWGPVPDNAEGYTTLIPSPETVLTYPGRGPEWGERVQLQDLSIEDGTAYVDFSPELSAHAGGALVLSLIREQIEATLTQFITVDEVVISIDGLTGVLEP